MAEDHAECIVVGGGPAGSAAALTLAKSGVGVRVFERGSGFGAKNVSGAILYANTLSNLVPEFRAEAPLERIVVRQRFALLTEDAELVVLDLHNSKFKERPLYNLFAVNRRKFDEWFAGQAIEAGADYQTGTRVDKLLEDKRGKVVGIESSGGRLTADVVILADGANSSLAKQIGLRKRFVPSRIGLGIKETIALPEGKIEERFNLEHNEGASFKYLGHPVQYSPGGAFILTNMDTVSVGIVVRLSDLSDKGAKPYELLESFKSHPRIRKLLDGGESQEYSAHILPEMGYDHLPELTGDGVLVAGDAAGLLNIVFHEGINLAMASGLMSGLTVAGAKRNAIYSNRVLKIYRKMLHESFVMKDMKMAMGFHHVLEQTPEYFDKLLKTAVQFATEAVSITDKPKKEQISQAWKNFRSTCGWRTLTKEAFRLWRLIL